MVTDSFVIHIKTDYFNKDIAVHVEKVFDASIYEVNGPLPKERNKQVIGFMND